MTLPTIIITARSGFVSFLGGSTGVPGEWKQWIAVTVGFMATIATILGGFQSTFKWGSKSDMFLNAAQQLQFWKIIDLAWVMGIRLKIWIEFKKPCLT